MVGLGEVLLGVAEDPTRSVGVPKTRAHDSLRSSLAWRRRSGRVVEWRSRQMKSGERSLEMSARRADVPQGEEQDAPLWRAVPPEGKGKDPTRSVGVSGGDEESGERSLEMSARRADVPQGEEQDAPLWRAVPPEGKVKDPTRSVGVPGGDEESGERSLEMSARRADVPKAKTRRGEAGHPEATRACRLSRRVRRVAGSSLLHRGRAMLRRRLRSLRARRCRRSSWRGCGRR
jgi:hypothetical protein